MGTEELISHFCGFFLCFPFRVKSFGINSEVKSECDLKSEDILENHSKVMMWNVRTFFHSQYIW